MTTHSRPDISQRFRAVVARGIERADREDVAALRASPLKRISLRNPRKATRTQAEQVSQRHGL